MLPLRPMEFIELSERRLKLTLKGHKFLFKYYFVVAQLSQLCSQEECFLTTEDFTVCIFALNRRADANSSTAEHDVNLGNSLK